MELQGYRTGCGVERLSKAYATDPVEARYILSPGLTQHIARFRENTNTPLRLSFARGRVHLLLPLEQDLFQPLDAEHIDECAAP